jgi:anaerobic ribonucleoside-triphosphate reductase activating protein
MRIHNISYPDANNGLGFRVTLWVSGCVHHCKGCQNQETWDFNSGREFTDEDKNKIFDILSLPYIKGITFSGGDPLCSYNDVLSLMKEIKNKFPEKDIWVYTGYTIEFIKEHFDEMLNYVNFIVDGKFIEEQKDVSLPFRGSKNQRIWEKAENGEFIRSKIENKAAN